MQINRQRFEKTYRNFFFFSTKNPKFFVFVIFVGKVKLIEQEESYAA